MAQGVCGLAFLEGLVVFGSGIPSLVGGNMDEQRQHLNFVFVGKSHGQISILKRHGTDN
jgi:hypothetical protein